MRRKQLCLVVATTLIVAVFWAHSEGSAEYPQDGYQWSNSDMSTKRSVCVDIIKGRVGQSAWANNNGRAAATLYCIESIDNYYEEHPKDHSLEQAKRETLEDILRFFATGQR